MPGEMTRRDQCVLQVTDTCALHDLHDSKDFSAATSRALNLQGTMSTVSSRLPVRSPREWDCITSQCRLGAPAERLLYTILWRSGLCGGGGTAESGKDQGICSREKTVMSTITRPAGVRRC